MIAFDTNVLVRLLTQDHPEQFALASAALEHASEEGCYISDVVLCEATWVLASVYGATRADLLAAVSALAADDRYHLDDDEAVVEAVRTFERGGADFADYLIGVRGRRKGARTTLTFDRKLGMTSGFTLLQ